MNAIDVQYSTRMPSISNDLTANDPNWTFSQRFIWMNWNAIDVQYSTRMPSISNDLTADDPKCGLFRRGLYG